MKSKKRHQSSSDESEDSDESVKSSSSSGSDSDASSVSEHRHKKKRKRADSSESESDSEDQKRSKKRKHKKKKKKHGKRKRRAENVEESAEEFSLSDGEISKKKRKHKHKHSKRARSSSQSEEEEHVEKRLHSVVKECRASSDEGSPSNTYYQREYRQSGSGDEYIREQEVERFYRGSSKERRLQYQQEQYHREKERYATYQDKNYKHRYDPRPQYSNPEDYERKQKEYDEYRRHQRYEERKPPEEYHRTKVEYYARDEGKGYNHYRHNQYEERSVPKRRDYEEGREYRERRPPPEPTHFREKEYPEKRERYQERFPPDRPREMQRERPSRPEKPGPPPPRREPTRSRSPDDRFRNRSRRPENPEEKEERFREGRRDERRDDRRPARSERPDDGRKPDARPRERKSRFGPDDNKEYSWGKTEVKKEGQDPGDKEKPNFGLSGKLTADTNTVNGVVIKYSEPDDAKQPKRRWRFGPKDNKEHSWGKTEVKKEGQDPADKEKPNFGLSGKLTADTNTVNGVVIKYSEPDDAKQPKRRWRFYPFKGDKALPILYIHRQSAFLIGRDKKVCDIHLEHPSISKQHAALQYRATPFTRPDGSQGRRVRPYIIDLESANGTFVNNKKIEARRYVELLERDVVKFGFSQREYVLLHENSKDDAQDDDNQEQTIGANVTTTNQIKQEKRVKAEVAEDGE